MKSHDKPDPSLQGLLPLDTQLGPASRISAERSARLIEGALDQWQASPQASLQAQPQAEPKVAWRALAMVASALLAFAVGARALYVWVGQDVRPAAPTTQAVRAKPAEAVRVIETTPEPIVEPAPVVAPESSSRPRVNVAEDGLLRANRLRAEGRYEDAVHAYNRVIRADQGVSSYVARVAAASLLLEHLNDAKGARMLFQAAAKQMPGGSLDREIRHGLVESSRRLSAPAVP